MTELSDLFESFASNEGIDLQDVSVEELSSQPGIPSPVREVALRNSGRGLSTNHKYGARNGVEIIYWTENDAAISSQSGYVHNGRCGVFIQEGINVDCFLTPFGNVKGLSVSRDADFKESRRILLENFSVKF